MISAEAGASCDLACFDVESTKDVGFVAIDAEPCGSAAVQLALYRVDASGSLIPVQVQPEPHGKGESCPDIPPEALKFDGLEGHHQLLCAVGVERAEVFVKSGRTCASRAFELPASAECDPDAPEWQIDMGAMSLLSTPDLAVDPSGNVLYAGYGGVSKLDGSGELLWHVGSGERVASDPAGNVLVAGSYAAQLGPELGSLVPGGNGGDVFVAKLDAAAHPLWAESLVTSPGGRPVSLASDAAGRVALAVSELGTLVLSPDGELLWQKPFWGALEFDAAGNLLVTGGFDGVIDVGTGPVESTGFNPDYGYGPSDAFAVKLDPQGSHVWSHFWGDVPGVSQSDQRGTSVAVDPDDNVLLVGEVSGSIRLFGEDHVLPITSESSNAAAYLLKLDPSGDPAFAQVTLFTEDMLDVASDSSGNIYVTGGWVGNVLPFRYGFVSKLDPGGAVEWTVGSSSSGLWPGLGRGDGLAVDACDSVYWSVWREEILGDGSRADYGTLARLVR